MIGNLLSAARSPRPAADYTLVCPSFKADSLSPAAAPYAPTAMESSADIHAKQIQSSESGDPIVDATNVFEEHSEEEERQLVRKLDQRILPIACLLYLFACTSPLSLSERPVSFNLTSTHRP
jgi:hypothetical protein